MSDVHFFHVGAATTVGVNAAIVLEHLHFWCDKNAANGRHYHDGRYWTYNSMKAFSEMYPYVTEKAIRTAISKLVDGGYIVTGNYSDNAYDRTKWYAVTELGESLLAGTESRKGQVHVPERANVSAAEGNSVYCTNSYIPDTETLSIEVAPPFLNSQMAMQPPDFVPPTVEEVRAYCAATPGLNHVNAELFVSYYGARGWMSGNTRLVNWQQLLVSWCVRERNKSASERASKPQPHDYSHLNDGWVTA